MLMLKCKKGHLFTFTKGLSIKSLFWPSTRIPIITKTKTIKHEILMFLMLVILSAQFQYVLTHHYNPNCSESRRSVGTPSILLGLFSSQYRPKKILKIERRNHRFGCISDNSFSDSLWLSWLGPAFNKWGKLGSYVCA